MNDLKELVRSTPPDGISSRPTFEYVSATGLSRTHSGRRRRMVEHLQDTGSLPPKPFKRLLHRLNRSATTSDLVQDRVPRGSIEVESQSSSSGRKYMKIALNPKLSTLENPSTYKINFQDLGMEESDQDRSRRSSKTQAEPENVTGKISKQASRLVNGTEEYFKRVKDGHPHMTLDDKVNERSAADMKGVNNGYSPSKGIPRPELGPNLQDFAAATLATAQAHARIARQGSSLPKVNVQHFRQPDPPECRRASFKGPYSVPIGVQIRPQRPSLPETPRTSSDDPRTLKESSPIVDGKAKASSTVSGSDSIATDGHSDAESGEIMSAQSAEFIQGQSTFGYFNRNSHKPPRSGPAPTCALPSLPEVGDSTIPQLTRTPKDDSPNSMLVLGISPKTRMAELPLKGHRYRLSPVKNSIRKDTAESRPDPRFDERFPQPPNSLISATSDGSSTIAAHHRQQEAGVSEAMASSWNKTSERTGSVERHPNNICAATANSLNASPKAHAILQMERPDMILRPSADPNKGNDYTPWRADRAERVGALKAREVDGVRSRNKNISSQTWTDGANDAKAKKTVTGNVTILEKGEESSKVPSLAVPSPEDLQSPLDPSIMFGSDDRENFCAASAVSSFSPVSVIAEQLPCLDRCQRSGSSHVEYLVDDSTVNENFKTNLPARSPTMKPDSILLPHFHCTSHPPADLHRTPSHSSVTISRQESSLPRPRSHCSTLDLELRIAFLEKKSLLLEKAFMAVVDVSSGFVLSTPGSRRSNEGREKDSCPGQGGEGEKKRASAGSDVLAP
ncbi:MAG: hypothetical protein Q9219_007029 [cf. Caloplaca sp. 3 TL-2023]